MDNHAHYDARPFDVRETGLTDLVTSAAKTRASSGLLAHILSIGFLILVSLAVLLPGLDRLPLTDRDEALFVQASKQMLETQDWVDIRFQDEPRYKKPVGIYWLQGLTVEATGGDAESPLWRFRLASLFGAIAVALFSYGIASRISGKGAGLLAGILAVTTVELAFEARIAKTDAMLCATILASQFALFSVFMDAERRQVLWRNALFWAALGLGTLIKGPVAPMIATFTLLGLCAMERSFSLLRALSPIRGLLCFMLFVLPWFVAIGWISRGSFFTESLGQDMLGKIATGQQSHGAPPGTHILIAIATFWPLSAFAPLAFNWAWQNRRLPVTRFVFFWIVPFWLICEITATKLPNYVLPVMPALAILAATAVAKNGLGHETRWSRLSYISLAIGGLVLGLGLNGGFFVVQREVSILGVAMGVVVIAASILSWQWLQRGMLRAGIAALIATTVSAYTMGYAVLMPQAQDLWLSDRIADGVATHSPCAAPTVIVVGYAEPSIVFRLGTQTQRVSAAEGATAFRSASCAIAVVASEDEREFSKALEGLGTSAQSAGSVEGRNLNGMKKRIMRIYSKS
jgi:4-amino-4-deoxy-L-arabinose transferase-like glycosyltransferase